MESRKRSSMKAVSYVAFHITVATLIWSYAIYLVTGEWEYEYLQPISVGFMLYLVWELVGYYIFERIWNNKWLRKIK
jgi:uncharacterized membrane protein